MRHPLWALLFIVCWSSGFVGTALAGPAVPTAGLLAWRYLLTAAVLGAALLVCGGYRWTRRELGQQAVLGLLAPVVFLGGVFASAALGVGAGTSALVCALQPMVVALLSRLLWRDALRPARIAGLALGLVAAVLAISGSSASGGLALLLPVASLLGLSANALLERRWAPSTPVLPALTIQVSVAGVVFVLAAGATGALALRAGGQAAPALVWLVLMSGLGGYAGYTVCLRRLGATSTSTLLYLTPPVTTLWAWAMFGQQPTLAQGAALALGAIAVVLVLRGGRRAPAARSPQPV